MPGSTFNLRGCSSTGGAAGASACGSEITVRVKHEQTENLTDSLNVEAELLANQTEQALKNAVSNAINDHLANHGINGRRIAFPAKLSYDCPKVGDVVRYDYVNGEYALAWATYDNNAANNDHEHLTEAMGIVESVETSCDGTSVSSTADATIVMFGEIEFKNVDLVNNALIPGTTYFLHDRGSVNQVKFSHNLSIAEPAISKPMLLATGKNKGIVTHYRPMTGSSSGGQIETEDYIIELTLIPGGWNVKVVNIGNLASRNPLVAILHYNQMVGGGPTHMSKHIGELRSLPQANVSGSEERENEFEFKVPSGSAEYGTTSSYGSKGVNGVGSLFVEIFSDTVDGRPSTDFVGAGRIVTPKASSNTIYSIPKLEIQGRCAEEQQSDIHNDIAGGDENLTINEGAMFEISSVAGVGGTTTEDTVDFVIPMPITLAVEMEWESEADSSQTDSATTTFKLPADLDQDGNVDSAVEVFPVNEAGGGITEKMVTLRVKGVSGELPEGHWASYLSQQTFPNLCSDAMCCGSGKAIIRSNIGTSVSITPLLGGTDTTLINNADGARLYTMSDDSNIVWPGGQAPADALEVSWKNVREDIQICYNSGIQAGTEPAFMTIYSNEARPHVEGQEMDQFDYDPRYVLAEIGAQDTLNGETIKVTLNYGTARTECCLSVTFNGTIEGTHYTIQELCTAGLLSNTTVGCPQSCG